MIFRSTDLIGCVNWECCNTRYTSKMIGTMTTLNWVGKVMCSALLNSVPAIPYERLTVPEEPPEPCDFGTGAENLDMCTWLIPPKASDRSKWRLGMGELSAWIGGPRADHTTSDKSGNYSTKWCCDYVVLVAFLFQRLKINLKK